MASSASRRPQPARSTSSSATAARCGCGRRRATTPTPSLAFFDRLSEREPLPALPRLARVDAALVEPFLDPDWAERGALVGTSPTSDGDERIVALASYARLRDPRAAEVAFAVADDLQGRGIGTRLLEQLAARAAARRDRAVRRRGARRRTRRCSAVFARRGLRASRASSSGGEVEVRFPIAPTERFRERVDERDHVAVAASLRPFFAPRRVAVDRRVAPARLDRRRALPQHPRRRLRRRRLPGQPQRRAGRRRARATASIEEIPDAVDLAVICVPGDARARRRGGGARARASARSASSRPASPRSGAEGASGRTRCSRSCAPTARGSSARTASASPSPALGLNATFAPRALPPGRIGFSSQSGALGLALLEKAAERGLGFSAFVSIGNKADVSSNDLLEWWEDDEGTDARAALPRVVRQPAQVRPPRAPRRAAQADPRAEGRHDRRRRARGELAHRRARRLRGRRRRALPPGGRAARADARGARRRRGAALEPAAAARPPRRAW